MRSRLDPDALRRPAGSIAPVGVGLLLLRALLLCVVALPGLTAKAWSGPAEGRLALFVLTEPALSAGPGPMSYAPGARAVTRLIFENRGAHATGTVLVDVALSGAVAVIDSVGEWSRDGDDIRATIDPIAPGDSVELTLIVELADGTERGATGTGGEARITALVPDSGETLMAAAAWSTATCADAYHAALRRIRAIEFAGLRDAVEATRAAGAVVPDARLRWLADRLVQELDTYLGQDRYPGLCTGVAAWTDMLGPHVARLAGHAGNGNVAVPAAVAEGFEGTLAAIRQAHAASCTCAR